MELDGMQMVTTILFILKLSLLKFTDSLDVLEQQTPSRCRNIQILMALYKTDGIQKGDQNLGIYSCTLVLWPSWPYLAGGLISRTAERDGKMK